MAGVGLAFGGGLFGMGLGNLGMAKLSARPRLLWQGIQWVLLAVLLAALYLWLEHAPKIRNREDLARTVGMAAFLGPVVLGGGFMHFTSPAPEDEAQGEE